MGRKAKSRQQDPPSLDEFRGEKRSSEAAVGRRAKKRAKKAEAAKQAKQAKVQKTSDGEEFEDAKADLFDSDEDVQTQNMFSDDEDLEKLELMNDSTAKHVFEASSDEDEEKTGLDVESESEVDSFDELAAEDEFDLDEDEDEEEGEDLEELEDEEGEEEEGEKEPKSATDYRMRIMETVKILENMSTMGRGKPRSFYTSRLVSDICEYYGYSPYMAEKYFDLFSPSEAIEFFEANETPRPIVLRTNTLKTSRRDLSNALTARGVNLQPLGNWSKVGLQVFDSQVPVGATPEYLAGHYILQAASSFLPVIALNPQPNERVLDMAAAPGGKTTYLSALMKDTGVVFANDSNKSRAKSLIANIHRLGCTNTIVTNYDAREYRDVMTGFNKVLLDAPCSGTGVVAKDQLVKTNRTEKDFVQLPHLQKQLLLTAIDCVDHNSPNGGYIVYSTCSVMPEENEAVVDYALRTRPNVELVDTELAIGVPGFVRFRGKQYNPKMSLTRRYYPHTYNVDGFYVAKFRKTGPSPAATSAQKREEAKVEEMLAEPFTEFADDSELVEKSLQRSQRRRGLKPTRQAPK